LRAALLGGCSATLGIEDLESAGRRLQEGSERLVEAGHLAFDYGSLVAAVEFGGVGAIPVDAITAHVAYPGHVLSLRWDDLR
jgi:hypothetical protein